MGEADTAPYVPRRLTIEQTLENAAWLHSETRENPLRNKTTLCNAALRIYREMVAIQRAGGAVYVREPGAKEAVRWRLTDPGTAGVGSVDNETEKP